MYSALSASVPDCFAVAGAGDGFTSPSAAPARRLDAIFAGPSLSVVSCEVIDTPGVVAAASDHRPVLAVLRQAL
jgi:endonuclease/exonuclease/phosphatase family metal-dependent hydrolase